MALMALIIYFMTFKGLTQQGIFLMTDKNDIINTGDSNSVKLKGYGRGFKITLDPSLPEGSIKEELSILFKNLKHLAVNAKVVIDTDGVNSIFCLPKFHNKVSYTYYK